jgi:hypothetical protein
MRQQDTAECNRPFKNLRFVTLRYLQVVTTTTRTLRRPAGALYNPNRVRHRSTTTTSTTTATATAETPATSTESEHQRRKPGARLVLRRKYGSSVNRTRDSDATASEVRPSDASDVASTNRGTCCLVRILFDDADSSVGNQSIRQKDEGRIVRRLLTFGLLIPLKIFSELTYIQHRAGYCLKS